MNTIFDGSGLLVLPFWALLIFLPRWRVTQALARSPLIVVGPAILYAVLVTPHVIELWPALANPSLPTIASLLGSERGATLAWLHFLAFDLFVGRWAYLDAQERNISALLVSPVLVMILMFGPLGFLLYLGIRVVAGRRGEPASDRDGGPSGDSKAGDSTRVTEPTGGFAGRFAALSPEMQQGIERHPALAVFTVATLGLLAVCLGGLLFDGRTISGAPAWLKPTKFAISSFVYTATLLWMLGFVRSHPRAAGFVANATVVGLAVELAIIVVQVVRGTTSHFNVATALDAALFSAMGVFVVVIWLANLVAAVLVLREPLGDRVLAWSLRLALVVTLASAVPGFLMTTPNADQRARMAAGERITAAGSHTVGAADGGQGLPVVGWSVAHGDLRVAHFVGLHALQLIPLAGVLLLRRRLAESHKLAILGVFAWGLLGSIALLTWQALRGQSVLAPDGSTLAAVGALVASVAIPLGVVLMRAAMAARGAAVHAPAR